MAVSAACGPKKAEWVASPEDEQAILRGEPPKHKGNKPGDEAYKLSDFGHSTAVEITPEAITVDGEKVIDLSAGRIDAGDLRDGAEGFLAGDLLDVLNAARKHLDVQKVTVLEKAEEDVRLETDVDYRIPFRTLAAVLYTAGQAEYNLYRVTIVKSGESLLKGGHVDITAPKQGGASSIELGKGEAAEEEAAREAMAAGATSEEAGSTEQEELEGDENLKGTQDQLGVLKTVEMLGASGDLGDAENLKSVLNGIDWEAEPVVATAGTGKSIYSSKSLNLSVFMTSKGFYLSAHIPGFKTKHIPRVSTGTGYDYNYEALYAAVVKIKVDHQKADTIYVGTENSLPCEYLAYMLNSVLWYKEKRMFKRVILTMSVQ
ncbi:MAG: hypothetical protein ABIJ56_14360 [Pseudomonadota bacterium]